MKLTWTHIHACNSKGTGFLNFRFVKETYIYTAVILKSHVIGGSKTSHLSWDSINCNSFFHKHNVIEWGVGSNLLYFDQRKCIFILTKNVQKKCEICQTNDGLREGSSSPTVDKSSGIFCPWFNNKGDTWVSEDDLKKWSTEVWQNKDLFFYFRIYL